MSCRSADKILCPWCGAEMRTITDPMKTNGKIVAWNAWMACENFNCQAEGPFVQETTYEEAMNAAKAAALRRYTLPQKPMTLEAVMRTSQTDEVVWVEDTEYMFANGYAAPRHEDLYDGDWRIRFWYPGCDEDERRYKDDYGKTWRCWERKPTDEERSAAGWLKP